MGKLLVLASDNIEVDGVPNEIKILPRGKVHSQKGDFIVDDKSFNAMYKQFKDRKLDLVVDYEHQTLEDVQAPAGGWIKDIYLGDDAVIAKIEWNQRAEEYLKNKEYRYLSPVVLVRKSDKRAVVLHSVALTNTPAIDGMFPIINSVDIDDIDDITDNSSDNEEENNMELTVKEILAMLGLAENATKEDVQKAIDALKTTAEKLKDDSTSEQVANSVVLGLLGLDKTAKTEDAAVAIMSLKNSAPSEDIKQLREEMRKKEAKDSVQLALSSGKITASMKDWATEYALSDKDGFEAFVAKAPVSVNMNTLAADEKDDPDGDSKYAKQSKLSDVESMTLKNCGMSNEDYETYGKVEE